MNSGKTEIEDTASDLQNRRKKRRRKLLIWLLVDLAVASIVLGLLFYRPGRYRPLNTAGFKEGQVSPHLTHELSPRFYNEAQKRKPFELVVTEEAINDIIARGDWPKESEGVMLYSPAALFVPGRAVLMGTADVRGVKFVITIEIEPKLDDEGLLNVHVTGFKVGAMNVTPLAKMIAKKMYAQRLAEIEIDAEALQSRIAAALLNEEGFLPVFSAGDSKVRLDRVAVEKGRMVLHFVPAS
jgi:hypothetical protein